MELQVSVITSVKREKKSEKQVTDILLDCTEMLKQQQQLRSIRGDLNIHV